MADEIDFKMFRFIFFVVIMFKASVSFANGEEFEEVCSCYDKCTKNFTTNSVLDVARTGACKRGCRFYAIATYTSHEENIKAEAAYAQNSCLMSCHESYKMKYEQSACITGCSQSDKGPCNTGEVKTPQFSFSFFSETDILFSAAELDPDYVHTDPGLRSQIAMSEESFMEEKPKLPEIRFRDLPVKSEDSVRTHVHANFKCPKFYGLDSKLEFRYGKIIVGDLYLFAGVFIFVVLCFLAGHHMETKGMTNQLREARMLGRERKERKERKDRKEKERLLEETFDFPDDPLDYVVEKSGLLRTMVADPEFTRNQLESITLVFQDDLKNPEECFSTDCNQEYDQGYSREKFDIEGFDNFETDRDFKDKNLDTETAKDFKLSQESETRKNP